MQSVCLYRSCEVVLGQSWCSPGACCGRTIKQHDNDKYANFILWWYC